MLILYCILHIRVLLSLCEVFLCHDRLKILNAKKHPAVELGKHP